MSKLSFRPVRADEVDVRVQSINSYKTTVLLYKDARVDMNILDETVGPMNWKREHCRENANCIVSIKNEETGEWVSKEDTGTESNTEAEKGLASDSFKRACVNWSIGRELYTTPLVQIDTAFVDASDYNGRLTTFDKFYVDKIEVDIDKKTGAKQITELVVGIEHKGQRDWVWAWNKEDGEIKTNKPSWVGAKSSSGWGTKTATKSTTSSSSKGWGKSNATAQNNESQGAVPAKPAGKQWGVKK